jgi:hypothetical protein
MKYKTEKGISVNIRIVDYEFPDCVINENEGENYDANWLVVYLRIYGNDINIHMLDQCMTTYEFSYLIKWFKYLSNNMKPNNTTFGGMDSPFSFELIGSYDKDLKVIRLNFGKRKIDLKASNDEIRRISWELEDELAIYPYR